ncbi:hypothetical protein AHAS_Ahas13G0205200 [Arachis hypogaea]
MSTITKSGVEPIGDGPHQTCDPLFLRRQQPPLDEILLRPSHEAMESNPHRRPYPHTLQCRLAMADGGPATVLMVGGLKSSFSLNASCSMILILRLNLMTMESEESEKMAPKIFWYLRESSKFKFGSSGGGGGGSGDDNGGSDSGRVSDWRSGVE